MIGRFKGPFWAVKVPTVNKSASPGRNGVTTSPVSAKDDQEEQGVDPGSVGIGHLGEIQIQVQNDVQEFCKPIHRAKTANESVIGRISATEIKKRVPRINLNVPTRNRVYTFERTSIWREWSRRAAT